MIHTESEALYKEACKMMPGGVNSPVRAFKNVGTTPVFIDHAKGDKIYDVDGNEYIDYVCSWGPNILGAARDEVINAVKAACERGLTYGAPTKKESELAKLVIKATGFVEVLRLVNSGTEAVMSAIRAARGYTGRDLVLKFNGCYHGHSDGMLVKAGSGLLTNAEPDSAGVPKAYSDCTLVCEYNSLEEVSGIFEKYGENIACIIVEPVAANMGVVPPKPGYLQGLKDICEKYGALLVFDEVITGFRLALGGAAQYYGVTPDLVTYGKIVGGGMPLAVYGGREEIMRKVSPDGSVYQAGTLSGNPIAVTAGIETLKLLTENPDIYTEIDRKTAVLEKAYRQSTDFTVNRVGSLMSVFFTTGDVYDYPTVARSDTARFAEYFKFMLEHGIYSAPSQFEAMFVSCAHSDEDIERTCEVVRQYFSK
ncbi:MAG: glutamate-1-semialdehyde 2,1-aminomutase [Eubacteriales bacterium]|nr:glutamate-1-semialdehyde 2,1-aminomutase [Eubacteriales bacterium]